MKHVLILVVDDDSLTLEMIIDALSETSQYDIVAFSKGQHALDYLENKDKLPDLIILDIFLPDIDGDEIVLKLRKKRETKYIPIILISAVIDAQSAAEQVEADDYLAKPFTAEELVYKAKRILS